MQRVIALLRVSSEAQAGSDRAGISRQREAVEAIAAAHGLAIAETIELHVSGASVLGAAEFRRMLTRLEEPGIVGVVVADTSRLMRPERLSDYQILEAFRAAGKLLYTTDGPRDVRTFGGRLLTLLQGELAAYERQQIATRTAAGRAKLRRAGHKGEANGLPRGVGYDFAARRWSYLEPEASRVREAFALALAGTTNLSEIGRRCGWRSPSGAARSVLGQSLYAGQYHGVPAPGLDPPLVDPVKWAEVQTLLRDTTTQRRPRLSGDATGAVYAGHLACARCGAALWTLPPRPDQPGFARYLCAHARDRHCPTGSISARLADPMIDAALGARLGSEETLRRLVAQAAAEGERRGASPAAELGRRIVQLDNRRVRILRQHELGEIDEAELRKRLDGIAAERSAVELAMAAPAEEIVVDAGLLVTLADLFGSWAILGRHERRAILRDWQIRVTVARPQRRSLAVESVRVGVLGGSRDGLRLYK